MQQGIYLSKYGTFKFYSPNSCVWFKNEKYFQKSKSGLEFSFTFKY